MAATSGSALALAARLRALDDDALERLVRDRGVRSTGIRDFFDLAESLLDRASIQAALQRLDRPTLAVLAAACELAATSGAPTIAQLAARLQDGAHAVDGGSVAGRADHLVEIGLMGVESQRYLPWDPVTEQLRSWPAFGLPSFDDLIAAPPPPALELVSESDARFVDRGASDHAFATLVALDDLLVELRELPARRVSRGKLALPDARRLSAATGVQPDEVELLLGMAAGAGLAEVDGGAWRASGDVDAWLLLPRIERWGRLAADWWDRRSPELRGVLALRAHAVWGDGLLDYIGWLYPAGGLWIRDLVDTAAREAQELGILVGTTPTGPGATLLLDGSEAASAAMAKLLPAEVDKVYLQHDLTVIAPGPLVPEVDVLLRGLAEAETRGVASTYRVTAASVTHALVAGQTADEILATLSGVSLTGMPQPLEYLVRDTAAKFGAIRVGTLDRPGARSYLRSDDAALLTRLLVDPNVATLALTPDAEDPTRLLTRFDADIAYWTLHDARYPVAAEDASGAPVALRRARAVVGEQPATDDTAVIVVQRVRAGVAPSTELEPGDGWVLRQLELAIKSKATVTVRVLMPNGSEVDYLLEPTGLAGGRLRARDRRADIERTLPVTSITEVTAQ